MNMINLQPNIRIKYILIRHYPRSLCEIKSGADIKAGYGLGDLQNIIVDSIFTTYPFSYAHSLVLCCTAVVLQTWANICDLSRFI